MGGGWRSAAAAAAAWRARRFLPIDKINLKCLENVCQLIFHNIVTHLLTSEFDLCAFIIFHLSIGIWLVRVTSKRTKMNGTAATIRQLASLR